MPHADQSAGHCGGRHPHCHAHGAEVSLASRCFLFMGRSGLVMGRRFDALLKWHKSRCVDLCMAAEFLSGLLAYLLRYCIACSV